MNLMVDKINKYLNNNLFDENINNILELLVIKDI